MRLGLFLFRLVCVVVFLTTLFFYVRERKIIGNDNNLKDCTITEIHCWHGKSGSSRILIQYKDQTDEVPINSKLCDKLQVGTNIKLYYDKDFQYFFKKGYINMGWIFLTLILVIISFTTKQIDRLNAFLKKQG